VCDAVLVLCDAVQVRRVKECAHVDKDVRRVLQYCYKSVTVMVPVRSQCVDPHRHKPLIGFVRVARLVGLVEG
jgi:hypothetical protein